MKAISRILFTIGVGLLFTSFVAKYEAQVVSVYDGDTITAKVYLGLDVYKVEKVRLYGLDAPEVRGEERVDGLKSRDALRLMLENAEEVNLYTFNDKREKYGRLLGIIHADGVNINKWMIEKKYAIAKNY